MQSNGLPGTVPGAKHEETTQGFGRAISEDTWVVVKIRIPFWVLNIIRHLLFRVPKKGP